MSSLQFVQQVDATPLVKKWNYIRVEQAEPQMSWYITPFTWWGCIACFQRIRKIALGTCYKATALWLKPKPCVWAFNARSPLEMASSIFHQSGINIQHSTGSALKEKMHNSLKCILSVATHKGQRYDEINKAIHKTYNYGHLVIFHISYQSCAFFHSIKVFLISTMHQSWLIPLLCLVIAVNLISVQGRFVGLCPHLQSSSSTVILSLSSLGSCRWA